MIILVEIDAVDETTGAAETLRFGSKPYTTEPGDTPANAVFRSRLKDPGNFERHLFGEGRTYGSSEVGVGEVVLNNADGKLDGIERLALDGRAIRIWSVKRSNSPWASRETVLIGTMDLASFNGRDVQIRLMDRLELLREAIQPLAYLGTTINGGLTVAEGNVDLKDVKKPMLFGRALSIAPVMVDQFDNVYQVASNALALIENVRDGGVKLQASQDYPTLAALKAATVAAGQYATCLALGLLRTGLRPDGTLTLDAAEGATAADRSTARVSRRILGSLVPVDEASFDALHAANPAECGLWISQGETTVLAAATTILASVGGWLLPDRFGVFVTGRLELPAGVPVTVLTRNRIIDRGEGFARLPTEDTGEGMAAKSLTVRFGRAYTTFSESDLKEVASDDAFRTFAKEEWRQVKVEAPETAALHPRAIEMLFETCFVQEADARAEADRLLAIYRVTRRRFQIVQASQTVAHVEPGACVTLQVNRYGLDEGRLARVLGIAPTYGTNLTTLDVWA
ncbi:hypothetical protein [Aureimonas sp. AU22]|uniref:hypothetical protein n=1 Tax=Aureimonas sp. AU22 TaxID=1638162 RepID=UPI00078532CE|nr:hypothetical protein [Aureimonas sp. AU22]